MKYTHEQQEAIGYAIARQECHHLGADWRGEGNKLWEAIADVGDELLRRERGEDAGSDAPVEVPLVPRYRWAGLSGQRQGHEGVAQE